jgi:predicted  nucleic acid-binding Zn-ribbon protein
LESEVKSADGRVASIERLVSDQRREMDAFAAAQQELAQLKSGLAQFKDELSRLRASQQSAPSQRQP